MSSVTAFSTAAPSVRASFRRPTLDIVSLRRSRGAGMGSRQPDVDGAEKYRTGRASFRIDACARRSLSWQWRPPFRSPSLLHPSDELCLRSVRRPPSRARATVLRPVPWAGREQAGDRLIAIAPAHRVARAGEHGRTRSRPARKTRERIVPRAHEVLSGAVIGLNPECANTTPPSLGGATQRHRGSAVPEKLE